MRFRVASAEVTCGHKRDPAIDRAFVLRKQTLPFDRLLFVIRLPCNAIWSWLFFAWRLGMLAEIEIVLMRC
jgi:hypothetical protein